MAHVIWGQEEGQAEAASHCLFLISSYTACPTIFAELFSFVIRYSLFVILLFCFLLPLKWQDAVMIYRLILMLN